MSSDWWTPFGGVHEVTLRGRAEQEDAGKGSVQRRGDSARRRRPLRVFSKTTPTEVGKAKRRHFWVTPPSNPCPLGRMRYQLEYAVPSVALPDAEEVTLPTFGEVVP